MPNHVTNILTIRGTAADIRAVHDLVVSEKTIFDFNKIVPMPEGLVDISSDGLVGALEPNQFKSMFGDPLERLIESLKKADEKQIENFCNAVRLLNKTGYASWLPWARDKWGTKWNAYEVDEIEPGKISFQTAWSTPEPVFKALSEKFPDTVFEIEYADEDIGSNCGAYKFKGGVFSWITKFEEVTDDSNRFACRIVGYDYDEWNKERDEDLDYQGEVAKEDGE